MYSIREKEVYDHPLTLADLKEFLTAIGSAITMLQKTSGNVTQALLRMVSLKTLPPEKEEYKDVQVKKMIKDLIVKLMEKAKEKAVHKSWCDTEMLTNDRTRKEKTEAVEMLTAEIDELTVFVFKLLEEITEFTKVLKALDAAAGKATGIRMDEKAKNKQTIKDAQEAQTAVAQALYVPQTFSVLKESMGEISAMITDTTKIIGTKNVLTTIAGIVKTMDTLSALEAMAA